MSMYKGYGITTTTVYGEPGKVTEIGYRALKAGTIVHARVLPGPFDSEQYARASAQWAARRWIDQQGA